MQLAAPKFTETDVTKAITGAKAAGFAPTRVDIDRKTGKISLFITGAPEAPAAEEPDEIGEWLANDSDQRPVQGHR